MMVWECNHALFTMAAKVLHMLDQHFNLQTGGCMQEVNQTTTGSSILCYRPAAQSCRCGCTELVAAGNEHANKQANVQYSWPTPLGQGCQCQYWLTRTCMLAPTLSNHHCTARSTKPSCSKSQTGPLKGGQCQQTWAMEPWA